MVDPRESERIERLADEVLRQRGIGAVKSEQIDPFDLNAEIAAMQKEPQS